MKKLKRWYKYIFYTVLAFYAVVLLYNIIYLHIIGLTLFDVNISNFFAYSTSYGYNLPFSKNKKRCASNIRLITGGIEIYNMDHSNNSIKKYDSSILDTLIHDKYINESFFKEKHKECEYASQGDLSNEEGFIYCKYHGDLQGKVQSKIQIQEKFLTNMYEKSIWYILTFGLFIIVSSIVFCC